ncbi:death-associated protein kinase 1-like [Ptychodera flava]|uniref:death-associated protein kinase 1-like n=1 Tax=Ptychodera flava TaxID=63121 RepID=UPI003969FD4C
MAVANNRDAITRLLLESKASIDVQDINGKTPLHLAVAENNDVITRLLLASKASIDVEDKNGKTPLHLAVAENNDVITRLLLASKASIDVEDKSGRTPLHLAVANNRDAITRLLLESKASIAVQDINGKTPLHLAVAENNDVITRLLLASKASIDVEDKDGETAASIAGRNASKIKKYKNIAIIFLEHHYDSDTVTKAVLNTIYDREIKVELSNHLKMYRRQQDFKTLMNEPGEKRNIMKICLCGYGGNGKTTLKHALQRSFIDAKLFQRSKEKAPASEKEDYEPTPGIDMATVNIPKAGKFGVWDFAGQTEYYVTHNMFLSAENSIFTIVFRITDEPDKQKKEVISWLAFIKAIITKSMSEGHPQPTVILVASRADQLKMGTHKQADAMYREIHLEAKKMFGKYLSILDEMFILNCHDSQHRDMDTLRACIKHAKREEFVPKLCGNIINIKGRWIVRKYPVIKWDSYVQKVKEIVPLIDDELLKKATRFLQYQGEILYIESTLTRGGDMIVLDPQWLCTRVIGPMLAPEIFFQYAKRLTKKIMYSRSDVEEVFKDLADISSLIDLLKEFELLYEVTMETTEGKVIRYVIPGMLENDMPEDQWKVDRTKNIYYGRRFQCRDETDSFSPGLFPRLQTRLERHFREMDSPTKGIWKNGMKVCRNVEGLIYMTKGWRAIHLCVRAKKEDDIGECYKMLELVTDDVYDVINICCPGTNIDVHILSADSLKNHSDPENVSFYTIGEIIEAEKKCMRVLDERKTQQEEAGELLCLGYDSEVLRSIGYQSDVKWMLQDAAKQFSIIMDRRRDFEGDYRIMADLMGFERAEVASWEEKDSRKSITQHILSEWSKRWALRKQDDGISSEGDYIYESTFTNLMKILRHKDCCVDIAREEIQKMFNKLGISTSSKAVTEKSRTKPDIYSDGNT